MTSVLFYPTHDLELEVADRYEVRVASDRTRIFLPPDFPPGEWSFEDGGGRALEIARGTNDISIRELPALLGKPWQAVWLEYLEVGRWRLAIESPPGTEDREIVTDQGVRIALDQDDLARLVDGSQPPVSQAEFDLALRAARLATHAGAGT